MKQFFLIILSVLLIFYNVDILHAVPLAELTESPQAGEAESKPNGLPESAKLFIGNISSALMAIDYHKNDVAARYLEKARQNLRDLQKEAPGFKAAEQVRAGTLGYITPPNAGTKYRQYHYVLFPFDDGMFSVRVPAFDKQTEKASRIVLKDAQAVYMRMDWNIHRISLDLTDAMEAVLDKENMKAIRLLREIMVGDMLIKEEIATDTLQSVYSNIMLAGNLLQDKNYTFSRYALNHARAGLEQYTAASEQLKNDDEVRALSNEMQIVAEELKKEDPTLIERIREKMKRWISTLRTWLKGNRAASH